MMRAAIVHRPLDATALLAEVADDAHGASTLFVGTVRNVNSGRDVSGIEYSAYESMATAELQRILAEASEQGGARERMAAARLGLEGLAQVVQQARPLGG